MVHALRIQTALSVIYPPRCLTCGGVVESDFGLCGGCWGATDFIGGAVCDHCGIPLPGQSSQEPVSCDDCITAPPSWVQGRSALIYAGNGRKLVLALKHGDRQEIARPAAFWMARAIGPLLNKNTLIAPVPLHWRRMVSRRYNQSALLAKALSRQVQMDWSPDLLQRPKHTKSLDGLGRLERRETLEDAIAVNSKKRAQIIGRDVLIVDDVLTSGATLNACAEVLVAAGAQEIRVVTLARVPKDN